MFGLLQETLNRIKWMRQQDRIGPDLPITHWRLHLKSAMNELCRAKFAHFGEDAEVRPGAYIIFCSRVHLGSRVVIRPGCMLFSDPEGFITIEDDVMLGSGVHVYVSNHEYSNPSIPIIDQGSRKFSHVYLRRGCWIGANAIILPGVEIGENAVVGAGSIVTKNVPARTVVAGNPAKHVNSIE
ncbi:MAG: acetyltransferase [Comamonadaceae bacterium CG12_big_fil_rev_8_21_14_0_65_59_15]|nr:MAG: acetyltransferase [Comamonadaceae bacterium CG12_big_fil_rev_8_21_14_0_65_59_15]